MPEMAKAQRMACPDYDGDPQAWLAEVLRARFDGVIRQRTATLDSNQTKGVHDMRVATRRLRSALRDFEQIVDDLSIKHVKKGLKKFADALGAVRDQDVAIGALEKLRTEADNAQIDGGIARLIDERRLERERAYLKLVKTISAGPIEELRERFSTAIDSALGQRELFRPASVKDAGREVISSGIDALGNLGRNIYDPFNGKALHKLRIAAKRLRYAIELFAQCWNGSLDQYAAEMSKLQSHLGEVRDCDSWIAYLNRNLKHNSTLDRQTAAWLISEFVRRRTKEYRAALGLWNEWETSEFARCLRDDVLRA